MTNLQNKNKMAVPIYCIVTIVAFAAVLIIPESREIFKSLSGSHPYIMGFIKFALLATVGEIFAIKLGSKVWKWPVKVISRIVIWGLIGVWVTYMMKIYTGGVLFMMHEGYLPGGESNILKAFFISLTMNTTFAPTFMALHKCSDKWLDLKAAKEKNITLKRIIKDIDWYGFASFTIIKTVPLFWIPAHTITFMLPAEYQVVMAATLSIALGIILSMKKNK